MRKSIARLLAAVALNLILAVLSPAAWAQTITYPTSTPIPSTTTDWVSSLTFPQFDPTIGTLNAVQLDLASTFNTTITITNNSASPSSGTVRTEVQLSVQDGGGNLITPQLDLLSAAYVYSLAAGDTVTSPTITKSGASSDLYTTAAVLAEFTGLGTITLSAATFTQLSLANTGGNTVASQMTDASLGGTISAHGVVALDEVANATVTVTYFYTPVPEPTSLMLAAVGMMGLPVCGWRRKR